MLRDIVTTSLAQAKILILDCCYSAMFKGDEIAAEFSGVGRYVIAATSETERASDGQQRGLPSPFTKALAEALQSRAEDRDGDGQVDLDDVYSYLETIHFDGSRPHRNFDGAGAVPIARRVIRQPLDNARFELSSRGPIPEGLLPAGDEAAVYALESAQSDLPYLDRTVSGASFSERRVDSFRAQMRSDLLEKMPAELSAADFLGQAGLMRRGRLTYAGLLLFGENPTTYLPAAVVQCVRFHGITMTAPLESIDLQGSVPELIVKARDFIAAFARVGELPTADGAYATAAYRYPMIAVREIIANAVVHRDYSDQETCVQIHAFDDRIEIISPGEWGGVPVTESGEHPIGQLERRSQKRNFRLAQTLTWSKLVEGVGAGVPRSIADCESTGAPEPVVVTDEHMVQVTILPSLPSSPERTIHERRRLPRYQQIAEDLRDQIESGELSRGERIPTEADLVSTFDASRNTIRDAIKLLISQGIMEARPGQGTFVLKQIEPFAILVSNSQRSGEEIQSWLIAALEQHREPRITEPVVEIQPGSVVDEFRDLTQVVIRRQEIYLDGTPWGFRTEYLPMDFVSRGATNLLMATDIPGGTNEYLLQSLGIERASSRNKISVRLPNEGEAAHFSLGSHGYVSILEIRRTDFGPDGNMIRVSITDLPSDRNTISLDS
jgi:DNA-binding GntR family transcriptional regulator